ncbi:hypothetical protein HY625_02135 [Candidatus Uhrbacteria bacterium]|nr:hypothetical protein [Candidatus Uhrbacteria bacterium]
MSLLERHRMHPGGGLRGLRAMCQPQGTPRKTQEEIVADVRTFLDWQDTVGVKEESEQ